MSPVYSRFMALSSLDTRGLVSFVQKYSQKIPFQQLRVRVYRVNFARSLDFAEIREDHSFVRESKELRPKSQSIICGAKERSPQVRAQ